MTSATPNKPDCGEEQCKLLRRCRYPSSCGEHGLTPRPLPMSDRLDALAKARAAMELPIFHGD